MATWTTRFIARRLGAVHDDRRSLELLLDKLNVDIESMALNKVNIEFLRKQMDKVLIDIEKLKDANKMKYTNGNGEGEAKMIESVIAPFMFVNGEIKECRIQESMAACLRGKRHSRDNTASQCLTNAGEVKQKQSYT